MREAFLALEKPWGQKQKDSGSGLQVGCAQGECKSPENHQPATIRAAEGRGHRKYREGHPTCLYRELQISLGTSSRQNLGAGVARRSADKTSLALFPCGSLCSSSMPTVVQSWGYRLPQPQSPGDGTAGEGQSAVIYGVCFLNELGRGRGRGRAQALFPLGQHVDAPRMASPRLAVAMMKRFRGEADPQRLSRETAAKPRKGLRVKLPCWLENPGDPATPLLSPLLHTRSLESSWLPA